MVARPLELELGDVERCGNLNFVRVYGKDVFQRDLLTLDEAFQTEQRPDLLARAVSSLQRKPTEPRTFTSIESDRVERLLVYNGLDVEVFIAGGMIFEGKSQNRASQFPVIIPPRSGEIRLPVRCAEHGQGLISGSSYVRSTTILPVSSRSGRVQQDRTWSTIQNTMTSTGIHHRAAPTEDYVTVAREARKDLTEYLAALGTPDDCQIGYIAGIPTEEGVFFYADMFGNQGLYDKLHERLNESVAIVASQHDARKTRVTKDSFASLIRNAKSSDMKRVDLPTNTAGKVYTLDNPVEGSVLMYDGTPVQLSLRKDTYIEPSADDDAMHTRIISLTCQ